MSAHKMGLWISKEILFLDPREADGELAPLLLVIHLLYSLPLPPLSDLSKGINFRIL
jgi:hypothetical protein